MKSKYILITILLLSSTFLKAQFNNSDIQRLKSDLSFLASDSLKGRYPGTKEDSIAAAYIANEFTKAGYLPLIGDSPMIPFEFTLHREVSKNVSLWNKNRVFDENIHFAVHPASSTSKITAKAVKIDRRDLNRDGNIKGTIGVVKCPDDSLMFIITPMTELGLSAIIFYNGDTLSTPSTARVNGAMIPVIQVTSPVAEEILKGGDNLLNIVAEVNVIKGRTYNVAAVNVKGKDKPYVLIGAHYDHLGFGGSGSMARGENEIHNGADDNASGVAAVLESARILKNNSRVVVVSAFGAEERGLIGSRILADTLSALGLLPDLMVNMDMVGRLNEEKLQIGGVGTFNGADSIVKHINSNYNFSITTTADGYGASDHASFYRKEVPVLYLTTGVHREYHTPADDVDLINFGGLAKITTFVLHLITNISDSGFTPNYLKTEAPTSPGRQSFKVTLGLIPDFTYEKGDGFRIGVVTEGRAASRGGLKEGDIITMMKGKKIGNIYDYMAALGELKPGEIIEVELVRDGQKISLTLNL
jgi:hypothetical protein